MLEASERVEVDLSEEGSSPYVPVRRLVAGNWKMNGDRTLARALANAALAAAAASPEVEVAVFPPYPLLPAAAEALGAPRGPVALGGQGCHGDARGAHTASVSASMLVEAGCTYVLCGHSEARRELAQDDARVRASVDAALAVGLRPLLCVGETEAERDAGRARDVILRQVDAVLSGRTASLAGRMDLAYEPVWAIGTGRNATPEQAEEAHGWIHDHLASPTDASVPASSASPRAGAAAVDPRPAGGAPRWRILYGGSVTPANIGGFLSQPGVGGVLVGGMSLDPASFTALVAAARSASETRRRP